ncbi:hypothetical protein EYR41_007520 [Orbilia oligospora]|uniref:Uncharacterized protein n=1 Tax=Orbilia oligospora TaxID=2813651 RepID=A0A8H2DYC0_ORBOL|nr:hypothetical protein TWF132_011663 [Orbilia oligospora]TGJ68471.1 hypothetical protein EYR41_007520 [Orbilia oligospora]
MDKLGSLFLFSSNHSEDSGMQVRQGKARQGKQQASERGTRTRVFSLFGLILEAVKCINTLFYGTFQPFEVIFFVLPLQGKKSEGCFREDIREKRVSSIEKGFVGWLVKRQVDALQY